MAIELTGIQYLHQQCKVYCDIAATSFDRLVEKSFNLVYKHLRMYFVYVSVDSSAQASDKCWLAILSEGVKVLRQWSIDIFAKVLLSGIVIVNPRLCPSQQCQLMSIISRAVDYFLDHHTVDQSILKGIIALASPDKESFLLLSYLIDVLASLASGEQNENTDDKLNSFDLESALVLSELNEDSNSDAKIAEILMRHFFIDQIYVAAMTPAVRRAVLAALRNGESSSQMPSSHDTKVAGYLSPVCCITLDPLLFPDGRITTDVVAVRSHGNGKDHAFLYRGRALFDWLGRRQIPISPETRFIVKPNDIYRLS